MSDRLSARLAVRHDERGIALLSVLLVIAVVGALTLTATAITVNNISNSSRDRQALGALASSEAGVAQAVSYLRGTNLSGLTCVEPAAGATVGSTCTTSANSWINASAPKQVRIDGSTGNCVASSDCFRVWIGTVQAYVPNCSARHTAPPGRCYGYYRVHSTGVAGNGPGARRVAVDVKVAPYPFPLGVFTEQGFSGNGTPRIHRESIFSAGCMYNRQDDSSAHGGGTAFEWDAANNRPVIDLFYDQPAAAHTVGNVSTSNTSCTSNAGGGPIHASAACDTTFTYDQDGSGGSNPDLTSASPCYGAYTRADGTKYPTSSKFSLADLQSYGYRPRGLTDAQYDALRAQAQAQGTYNLTPSSVASALASTALADVNSPVLFWDSSSVSLPSSQLTDYMLPLDQGTGCSTKSVTIVVVGAGHDLTYSGGSGPNTASTPRLVASIFVPDGTVTGNGGRDIIGTVFAKTIDLGGSPDFYMDGCFASNPPGATLDVQVTGFREDDGTDVN